MELDELAENYCPISECRDFGKKGQGNLICYSTYGPRKTRLLYCRTCGHKFSERRNTLFFGLHTNDKTVQQVIKYLIGGNSIRSTAKLTGLNKDTVHRIYERVGLHCQRVFSSLMRDLRLESCALAELLELLERRKGHKQKPYSKHESAGKMVCN